MASFPIHDLRAWLGEAIEHSDARLPVNNVPSVTESPSSANTGSASSDSIPTTGADEPSQQQTPPAQNTTTPQEPDATATTLALRPMPPKPSGSAAVDSASFARKLVTVRPVKSVEDFSAKLNLVTVDGWDVIVPKVWPRKAGEFVLFFEVDSFIPEHSDCAQFFGHEPLITFDGHEGHRVQTKCLINGTGVKAYSQGHIIKLGLFPSIHSDFCRRQAKWSGSMADFIQHMREVDYADRLGVVKWEAGIARPMESERTTPEKGSGSAPTSKANPALPIFIKPFRTSMERVQNCPNLFTKPKYKNYIFQETRKVDGQTMTCYFVPTTSKFYTHLNPPPAKVSAFMYQNAVFENGRFGVCSRNIDIIHPDHIGSRFWDAAVKYKINDLLVGINKPIAIQGEYLNADFHVFSVMDLETGKRWHPRIAENFAKEHGLKHVYVLGYATLPAIARNHQDLMNRAELQSRFEGLVFKNCTDGRWFKVLSNSYLLENGDEAVAAAKDAGSPTTSPSPTPPDVGEGEQASSVAGPSDSTTVSPPKQPSHCRLDPDDSFLRE